MEIKTKSKPLNKKRVLHKVMVALLAGVAFGAGAAIVFAMIEPHLEESLEGMNKANIVIETVGDSNSSNGNDGNSTDGTNLGMDGTDNGNDADYADVGSLQKLEYTLYSTGNSASRSVVGINETATEGFLNTVDYSNIGSGIIITHTDESLFILAAPGAVGNIINPKVTFYGGQTVTGSVVASDRETRMAIIEVKLSQITSVTQQAVKVIELGNSRTINRGLYVIAIGNPLGEITSVVTGQVTSITGTVNYIDREYELLQTNISAKSYAGGFLINSSGKVIGVLTHDADEAGEDTMLNAIGISELTGLIEDLCNQKTIPYVGVQISTISSVLSEIYGLSEGVYVESVVMNSPAVEASIQVGDIIVGIGKKEISTGRQFYDALMLINAGTKVKIRVLRYSGSEYKSLTCEVTIGSH